MGGVNDFFFRDCASHGTERLRNLSFRTLPDEHTPELIFPYRVTSVVLLSSYCKIPESIGKGGMAPGCVPRSPGDLELG
jgi:hypothetical protein